MHHDDRKLREALMGPSGVTGARATLRTPIQNRRPAAQTSRWYAHRTKPFRMREYVRS
jgi:hypothetical protein